ncbi:type 2 periplasmic-binding domain-containing protein [Paenibacillus cymbidii]|uniref:extracellular solute-binding protein n=1 Tax=Paenibacillus cymbidii TaxID=1639034 RepID=UPI00108104B1|nr:extracellular solute-binding protein [Paenibacillus cymbidii]
MNFLKKASPCFMIAALLLASACSQSKTDAGADGQPAGSAASKDKTFDFTYERFSVRPFQPPENNPIDQMLKKDLNVNLKLTIGVGDYNNWAQQFSTRVAADDLPDFVFLNRQDLMRYAASGTIIPLDDLLNKNPELKNRLDKNQWMLSNVNGKIYGVPNLNPIGPYDALYIRKDWLDKLHLAMPKTTDEFMTVLKAFTFNDPDGNGKDDTFGFTTDDPNFVHMSALTNSFGLPQFASVEPGVPMDWIDSSGKLHFGPTSDEYKQYIVYMAQLKEAGVIDPDIASNTFAVFKQKMAQGKAGVVPLFLPQQKMFEGNAWLADIKKANPDANWVYLPPLKGPKGYSGNNADSPDASYFAAVTKKVLETPGKAERAIDILNYEYRDGLKGGLGGQFIDFGQEGVHHKSENGKIVQFLPQYNADQDKYINVYTMGGLVNSHDVLKINIKDAEFKTFEQMNADRSKGNLIANYYYQPLSFSYDGSNYIREMSLKFIYGKESMSKWDDYAKTLNERYKYTDVQKERTKQLQTAGLLK